jgi:1,4-dihydroxy-2-naphthoyl-CoA synthase
MALVCRTYDAQRAYQAGLISKVVAVDQLMEEVHLRSTTP